MPRNPNKRHCQTPGCNNWAMRGYAQCRSHLDPVLGSRGAGAPFGNLNALKTGQYANPAGYSALSRLAHKIAADPDSFPETIAAHIDELYCRVGYGLALPRSLRTIIALHKTTEELIPHLINVLFIKELDALAQSCPFEERAAFKDDIWALLAPYPPRQRLMALVQRRREAEESQSRLHHDVDLPSLLTFTSEI